MFTPQFNYWKYASISVSNDEDLINISAIIQLQKEYINFSNIEDKKFRNQVSRNPFL